MPKILAFYHDKQKSFIPKIDLKGRLTKKVASCKTLISTRLIKTVRLRMTLVEELLRDADLSLKVIFLVRDPRGVMNSRDSMDWCSDSSACGSVDVMCKDLYSDVRYANELNEKYPNRLLLVRYAHFCSRLLTFAHFCPLLLTYAHFCTHL